MTQTPEKKKIDELRRQLDAAQETIEALKRAAAHRSESPITEQVAIQKALAHLENRLEIRNRRIQESVAKYRALFEQSPLIAMTLDKNLNILEINSAGGEALGAPVEDLVGKNFLSFFAQSGRAPLETVLRKGGAQQIQSTLSDGRILACFCRALPGGEEVQVLCRDITTQLASEEKKQHAQRLEALGQLAGGIAHDFNNLLTAIIGFAELIPIERDPLKRNLYVEQILNTSERASQLVSRLLGFSRRGKIVVQEFDMHHVIEEVLLLAWRTFPSQVRIKRELNAREVSFEGDVSQWENAILNLILNAKDAIGESGVLSIRTFNEERGEDKTPLLVIEIADTGAGIAEEDLPHIFEPFFSTKEIGKGTGLGLSVVYGTVKNHGGEIEVHSKPGEGATFTIRLPFKGVGSFHPQTHV